MIATPGNLNAKSVFLSHRCNRFNEGQRAMASVLPAPGPLVCGILAHQ